MDKQVLEILQIVQIVISALIVILVMLQNRSDGLGGMFGGSGGEVFRTKRGLEKVVYRLTIVFSIILCVISLLLVKYAA